MSKSAAQKAAEASIKATGGRRMIRSSPITRTRPSFDMTKEVKKEEERRGGKG